MSIYRIKAFWIDNDEINGLCMPERTIEARDQEHAEKLYIELFPGYLDPEDRIVDHIEEVN